MLESVKALLKLRVNATDGKVGKAQDFFFDDETWLVRDVVVNTGGWLSHCVVVPPGRFDPPEAAAQALSVSMTRDEVKHSPAAETEETLNHHQEEILHDHYGASVYTEPRPAGAKHAMVTQTELEAAEEAEKESGGSERRRKKFVRSVREILGYQVQVQDGRAGRVDDFLIGDDDWEIHYLVVDTKDELLSNPKVLAPAAWVEGISWAESCVYLTLDYDQLKRCQKYDPSSHAHIEKPA